MNVLFLGTPEFAATILSSILESEKFKVGAVVTQPDRPAGRKMKLKHSAVKELALKYELPILQPGSIKKEGEVFLKELSTYGPFDVGVVVAFGQILPVSLLDLPSAGCVNIHASLLPRWRGAAPIQRAIIAGDTETGVNLVRMEAGLDTGPIYSTVRIPIEAHDDFGSIHDILAKTGATLLIKELELIAKGRINPLPQKGEATYAAKILNEERMISWDSPAQQILNQIRGLSPAPGAFTLLKGKRLKILKASVKTSFGRRKMIAGAINRIDRFGLEITCEKDVLSIEELQLEGKNRLHITEFLKGVSIDEDTVLGG